jgi:hypothetical protein
VKPGSSNWAVEKDKPVSHAIATYEVSTAVAGPRTVYRKTFDLGFVLPSPESSVAIDPAGVHLRGDFTVLDTVVPAASISNGSPPVVTLDSAREVRQVRLTKYAGLTLQLFRLDQQQLASKPTVTAGVNSGKAAGPFGGFTDVRFAVAIDDQTLQKGEISGITVRGAPTGGKLGLVDPDGSDDPTFFWPTPDATATHVDAGPAFAAALQAYFAAKAGDLEPSVRFVIQCDQPCVFTVTAFDTGASFALDGFAFPELAASDLTDPDALAARIAAAADPVSAHLRSAIGSAALLDGLNAVVAGKALYDAGRFAGITLSPQTEAAKTAGDPARLNRLLLQDAYPDLVAAPSTKRVLRFPADRAGQARVAVSLPAGAVVSKAALSTQESLRGDRPDDAGAASTATGRSGVHVSGDDTAAVSVTVDQALTATGLALPLLGLTSGTQVSVQLRADDHGAPAGKALATATAALSSPGAVEWSTVYFDPVVLGSDPVWIVLRAAKGEAVWLAASSPDGLRVVRTRDDGGLTESVLPGLQPLFQLLSRSGSVADAPATTLQLAGKTLVAARDGDKSSYDLAAALQAVAAAGDAVPLTFTSTAAGTITVYPPHVEYEI